MTPEERQAILQNIQPPTAPTFYHAPMDRNCLSYWYPKIANHVPTPDTFFVRVADGWRLADLLAGGSCWYFESLCEMLRGAAEVVGTPCFLRTGQGSGKHNWKDCCYVTDAPAIGRHVMNLVEWSHRVALMGLPHDVWVVRKMLPTRPAFHCARYGGMPVVREWRYFVDGPKVLYGIPYWPEVALGQGGPDVAGWRDHLTDLHAEISGGAALANEAGARVGGRWSVDVLDTTDGPHVTDMAVAERSWGWEEPTP